MNIGKQFATIIAATTFGMPNLALASTTDPGRNPDTTAAGSTITAAAPETDSEKTDATTTSPNVPAPQDTATIGAVIVTAHKQKQNLQETPAAITAISGAALEAEGVGDIRAVEEFVPSVRFQQEGASTEIYIRGVGSTLDFPQIDPPTSLNFNGIYIPREGTSVGLYDVDQIEVLPGPQGTLYGRSTLGGAVNVNFRRPTQERETSALVEAGNYDLLHTDLVQNVPVGRTLAFRGAIDYTSRNGYMTSGADSAKDFGGRLSLLYTPSSALTAYLWGATANLGGSPPNLVPKGVNPANGALSPNQFLNNNPWDDQFPASYASKLPMGQPQAEHWGYNNKMVGAQVDYKFGGNLTLTYIPSYLTLLSSPDYWLGAFPANKTDRYEQTTHELRLAGAGSRLNWLAGLYAYRLVSHGTFVFDGFSLATGVPVNIVDHNRIQGTAAFGQGTASISDHFRVTAGGRFSIDDRDGAGRYANGAELSPYTYGHNFNHFDFKLGEDYDVAPHVMLYTSVQTGYQPGTFNAYASTPQSSNAVDSSSMTAYTTGVKSRLLDDRLQLNDELFYYDYRDLFASAYDTVTQRTQTFNAQKVEIYGNQIDVVYKPTADDQFNISNGYLHARNKDFELPDGTANYDGYQLQYAPDWTISAGYFHDFQLGHGYLRAQASTRYESPFYADFNHTPGGRQRPYTKSDASLTYNVASGRWSIGAWVKNIENVAVIAATAGGSNLPFNPDGATAFLEAPRTFGLRFTLYD